MTNDQQRDFIFSGLKVVDMASVIAGPVAATILADFGADVVKVEPPGQGDLLRWLSYLPTMPNAPSDYFWQMDGRNKRSIELNLKTPEGMQVLRKLIAECDVLVTNQPLASRRRMGLTYDEVKELNPDIIYASLTAYGEKGPHKDDKGFDLTAYWQGSGLMDLVRGAGETPSQAVPGMGDHPTAVTLYAGIVTALLHRERTGKGSMVHTSLLANGLWAASAVAQGALAGGAMDSFYDRKGRPQFFERVYKCADGRFLQALMVQSAEHIQALCAALGLLDLLADPRFATPEGFAENAQLLGDKMQESFLTKPSDAWLSVLHGAGVPVERVTRVEEAVSGPQVDVNRMAVDPVDEGGSLSHIINHPIKIDGVPQVGPKRAPRLGEHSTEILAELGYGADEIAALVAKGVV